MKVVQFIKLAGSAAIVLACTEALAQPSSAPQFASSPAQVAKSSKAADRQLAKDVRRALRAEKHQGQRFSNITVRVNNGVVTLSGSVPATSLIDLAIATAKGVNGVESVNSRLAVRSEISDTGSR